MKQKHIAFAGKACFSVSSKILYLAIYCLKFSAILKLIIQITLTLIRGIFLDSVISAHLISQLAPVTNKLISSYSLIKEIEILHQIIDHSKFASRCLKRTSAHWVICTYRKLKGFSVCYKTFLGVLKVIASNIYFRDQHDLPLNAFIMWLILM